MSDLPQVVEIPKTVSPEPLKRSLSELGIPTCPHGMYQYVVLLASVVVGSAVFHYLFNSVGYCVVFWTGICRGTCQPILIQYMGSGLWLNREGRSQIVGCQEAVLAGVHCF